MKEKKEIISQEELAVADELIRRNPGMARAARKIEELLDEYELCKKLDLDEEEMNQRLEAKTNELIKSRGPTLQ